ncbi:MAG: NADH:ubiquinone reductase (Na(+)-transporting) subunit A, partial [Muribaculaceae bacterium]|nr:NADH:ubiquinone reductase (Na(+)-transporting) subunit A [Muribaculaceae bacterium]
AVRIGRLFSKKKLGFETTVAITGPMAKKPHLVKTIDGAALNTLLEGEINDCEGKVRVISGNVLTGIKENVQTGFLRFPYRQVTLIKEGDDADEFMGWASMNPKKFSVKRSFPAFLAGLRKPFNFDARIKGGHRAMILSGEYDKVFPFDIYPEYLLKAIYSKDIEKMEQLGIYEVAPEDFALPEFVDTSKNELQKAVREVLDYLRKETLSFLYFVFITFIIYLS